MSTKTFKSVMERSSKKLIINKGRDCVPILIEGIESYGIDLKLADAPALALAILEAAGVEPLSEHYGANNDPSAALSHASHFLAKHAELTQAAAKEAADREALEGEALRLYRVTVPFTEPSWADLSHNQQQAWTVVATVAREIHGVKS